MRWRYADTALTLCTLAFFATMVARLAISPVVPLITADFGGTNGTLGLALWVGALLVGAILTTTAVTQKCPLNAIFGINTYRKTSTADHSSDEPSIEGRPS